MCHRTTSVCLPVVVSHTQNTTQVVDSTIGSIIISPLCKYQSDACSTSVGTCSLSMRLFKGSGNGQSKQRVDGKDWLITVCNWWSIKAVRVTTTELTKTNKLN